MMKTKKNTLAGSFSGITARLVCQPLDVVKIRFQLQIEPISKKAVHSKYTGVFQCLKTMVCEEGVSSLWKGLIPGTAMYAIYGGIQFTGYGVLQNSLVNQFHFKNDSVGLNFIGGCFGGAVATAVCYPLDVLRTRFVGQGNPRYYTSLTAALKLMYFENGIRTFYKGLVPTLIAIVPQTGLNFGFYSLFLSSWRSWSASSAVVLQGNKNIDSLVCGAMAGMSSKVLTLPFDIIKKRLQVQGFEKARQPFGQVPIYTGAFDVLRKIIHQESVLGLYKGGVPSILKASLSASVSFYAYEYALKCLDEY